MLDALIRRPTVTAVAAVLALAVSGPALAARQATPAPQGAALQAPTPAREPAVPRVPQARRQAAPQVVMEPEAPESAQGPTSAERIRERFGRILDQLPDSVGSVLKLDPSLLTDESFLAPYPALGSFLSQYPAVARNPQFYLAQVIVRDPDGLVIPEWRRSESYEIWSRTLAGLGMATAFLGLGGLFVWLVRAVLDHRRWNRMFKLQTDFQNKIFDRFSSSEDLLAYIQTPAGRRLVEAAPIVIDQPRTDVGMPLRGILWAVQAGLVLVALGVGFQIVGYRLPADVSHPLAVLGVLALSLGVGFVLAAGASFLISRRLGLLAPRERGGVTPQSGNVE